MSSLKIVSNAGSNVLRNHRMAETWELSWDSLSRLAISILEFVFLGRNTEYHDTQTLCGVATWLFFERMTPRTCLEN